MPSVGRFIVALGASCVAQVSGCSLLFEPASADREQIDAGAVVDASLLDADPLRPDAGGGEESYIVTITISSTTGGGQVSLINYGGVFCNLASSPCDFEVEAFFPLRLVAAPPEDFFSWVPSECPTSLNQNTMSLTVTKNCAVEVVFSEEEPL